MRTGGKNRQAAGLHVLRATFRPARHGQAPLSNPAPGGRPVPPDGLPAAVLHQWHVTVAHLEQLGIVSTVDALIVEQYARLHVETAALADAAAATGAAIARLDAHVSGLTGAELVACVQELTKLRQLETRHATQIRQGRMAQRQYLIELNLTPASRARGISPAAGATAPLTDPKKARYLRGLA
jgi:hypothetical protein